MKKNIFHLLLLLTLCCTALSCKDEIVADFTYSPELPAAGKKVTFSNSSSDGSSWDWNFGDGGTATTKSPTYTFKKPGSYTVTLRVNGSGRYSKTQIVHVIDTVPSILHDSIVYFNKAAHFSVSVYNPNSETVKYKWTLPDNATSDSTSADGYAYTSTLPIIFHKHSVSETVKLELTVGSTVYNLVSNFDVVDVALPSLLYITRDGILHRQRLTSDSTFEASSVLNISGLKHPYSMSVYASNLFIFDAGTTTKPETNWENRTDGDGSIRAYDLAAKNSSTVITNSGYSPKVGFYNGSTDGQYIYWTDYSDSIYRIAITERNKQYAANYKIGGYGDLGYSLVANQVSGGFCVYGGTYFWAKGGTTDKGIYRFSSTNIGEKMGDILTDCAIGSFVIDANHRRIYYTVTSPASSVGLWTSALDGTDRKRVDDSPMYDSQTYITGLAIDYVYDRLYWGYTSPYDEDSSQTPPSQGSWEAYYQAFPTHRTGIKYCELLTSFTQTPVVNYALKGVSTYGVAFDQINRLGN